MCPYSVARQNSAIPFKRYVRAAGIIIVIFANCYVSCVEKTKVVRKAAVPMSIIYTARIVKQVSWVSVSEEPVMLPAHMVSYRVGVGNMNLTKGSADSANITISICIVCVVKVCIGLGSGFASQEHR